MGYTKIDKVSTQTLDTCYSGSELIDIKNEFIHLSVSPQFGGKITSMRNRETDTEFLQQPLTGINEIPKPEYGMKFLPPYSFGFDECFPTISACSFLLNGEQCSLPDYGEVWNREWKVKERKNLIEMQIEGEKIDYKLSKRITLCDNEVLITYNLLNFGDTAFEYLWSPHPLLLIKENDEILLPEEITEVETYFSTDSNYQKGEKISWPLGLKNGKISNKIPGFKTGFAAKIFAKNLRSKKVGLYRKTENQSIIFDFTHSAVQYLGIWMTYGGWPEKSMNKEYAVALEPTTTSTDSLQEALREGTARHIKAGQSQKWSLKILIENYRSTL